MSFPSTRMRRLRRTPALRSMVCETIVHPSHLVRPLFVVPGETTRREISSLPGQYQLGVSQIVPTVAASVELGISTFLFFAIPEYKDDVGSAAWARNGLVQQAMRAVRAELPHVTLIADLCFCEYTSHGHCGVMVDGCLDNDATLMNLGKQAVSLAEAGADVIAPSGMIDGMVSSIRRDLDEAGFTHTVIMSYAAKYASAFYGPFRDAVESAPQYGDRCSYQMDPGNVREALREVELDLEEGADIVMVKPALPYLDIISQVAQISSVPIAAYNVSGEYAMVKAAAAKGWIDGERTMIEMLTSIRRAGADIIITYFADEFCARYRQGVMLAGNG
jgi:porphobilinogen synthase